MKQFELEKKWVELISKSINREEAVVNELSLNLIYRYMMMYADEKTIADFRKKLMGAGYIG
jgi:hypothetical protein